jgi:hypothetical protein
MQALFYLFDCREREAAEDNFLELSKQKNNEAFFFVLVVFLGPELHFVWSIVPRTKIMSFVLDDVLFEILCKTNAYEVLQMSLVCKEWHAIATSEPLWERLVLQRFSTVQMGDLRSLVESEGWLGTYKQLSSKRSY